MRRCRVSVVQSAETRERSIVGRTAASPSRPASVRRLEREEFVALVVRHERRLRAFVATMLARVDDIDEVVQNASLVAWRKIESFSYGQAVPDEEFVRWLCTIARYEASAYRRQKGAARLVFDEDLLDRLSDMRLGQGEYLEARHRALIQCLQRLTPKDRETICKRYCDELPVQTLAEMSGRSIEGIYKSLSRIRTALLVCIDRALRQEAVSNG